MPASMTTDSKVLAFHKDTYVFDGLAIAYTLDENYRETDVSAIMGGNWLRCVEKFCG